MTCFSLKELLKAQFYWSQLKEAGYTPKHITGLQLDAREAREVGLGAAELREAGYTCNDMFPLGFSSKQCFDAGYS